MSRMPMPFRRRHKRSDAVDLSSTFSPPHTSPERDLVLIDKPNEYEDPDAFMSGALQSSTLSLYLTQSGEFMHDTFVPRSDMMNPRTEQSDGEFSESWNGSDDDRDDEVDGRRRGLSFASDKSEMSRKDSIWSRVSGRSRASSGASWISSLSLWSTRSRKNSDGTGSKNPLTLGLTKTIITPVPKEFDGVEIQNESPAATESATSLADEGNDAATERPSLRLTTVPVLADWNDCNASKQNLGEKDAVPAPPNTTPVSDTPETRKQPSTISTEWNEALEVNIAKGNLPRVFSNNLENNTKDIIEGVSRCSSHRSFSFCSNELVEIKYGEVADVSKVLPWMVLRPFPSVAS